MNWRSIIFFGSGTTAVAAVRTGWKFIGFDEVNRNFDIACQSVFDSYSYLTEHDPIDLADWTAVLARLSIGKTVVPDALVRYPDFLERYEK